MRDSFAGLWPEQGLQPVTRATALRRWFVTLFYQRERLPEGDVAVACPERAASYFPVCFLPPCPEAFWFEVDFAHRLVLIELESVLSSVTLWTTGAKPLPTFADSQAPVPETPKFST